MFTLISLMLLSLKYMQNIFISKLTKILQIPKFQLKTQTKMPSTNLNLKSFYYNYFVKTYKLHLTCEHLNKNL